MRHSMNVYGWLCLLSGRGRPVASRWQTVERVALFSRRLELAPYLLQIPLRLDESRPQRERALEPHRGVRQTAPCGQCRAQVRVGLRIGGVRSDRRLVMRDGFVEPSLP